MIRPATRTAKFDLMLTITEREGALDATLNYNADLFQAATIERMLGHFQTLLEGIVANPDQRISDIPLLTQAEKHQLLEEWNDTDREYPKEKCIHQLFEAQAEKTPDAIAVVFEEQQLTYQQLNKHANKLARYLRQQGIEPGDRVGICLDLSSIGWWVCWEYSKPAALICHSIPIIRPNVGNSCWRMRRRRSY